MPSSLFHLSRPSQQYQFQHHRVHRSDFASSIEDLVHRAIRGDFVPCPSETKQEAVDDVHPGNTKKKTKKIVTLLHPPGACSAFTRSGSQYPPLGLLQLKAVIGDSQKVDVLEADAHGWTANETVERIRHDAPLAVGMTVTCGTKKLTHAWSTVVKNMTASSSSLSPSSSSSSSRLSLKDRDSFFDVPLVIVGGPAAAFESDSIFYECPNVDVVVKGEGEVTFPKIVRILEEEEEEQQHNKRQQLVYESSRSSSSSSSLSLTAETVNNVESEYRSRVLSRLSQIAGVVVRDHSQSNDDSIPTLPKESFSDLPFPDLSASPVDKYTAPDAKRLPMVTMMTQRGCIAECAFCNTPQIHGKQMRGWTNEQIIEQLVHLKSEHGIRQVSFVDDVFTNRPGGGPRQLCQMMIERQLDLTWYCNARADQISAKMAHAMRAAGCHQVFLGFESGCDEMLQRIRKGETVAQLERGARILKEEAGIDISIGFIVGLPGETDESVNKTIELCHRVQPTRVQFTRFTPIPGSALATTTTTKLNFPQHGVVDVDIDIGEDENIGDIRPSGDSDRIVTLPETSFHDRSHHDQVEAWLAKCYEECQYKPSV